ncbi:hypothetical protein CKY12_09820 [Photorhabdus sp. S12-55]|uniref:L-asparaginase n=1 Tax=Photorhabdus laumondii subsp. clarkei TaxID=2029685 RepID=A0A329VLN3_9GAMM|nr:hypothetical protein CKY15_11070 [Photorhabdus sp. S7-51]RAW73253.1 hypothetical protein CKY14_08375 [Photorhabdus sp. S14-60]RAW78129.1 hypothetical protein CKY06_09440 [Photorhabdus sp. S15-56]RAW85562.1 hypothetical protein CKY09_10430 [Photorhabdus sp. S5P8-50]RAW85713.1 hypothetical protein CKY12_09820 [Photorhabdus sp. S12-55]RAW92719.1 hypothetical protein CKY01_04405 [Photorhabdus laumondii subsp. clarkei]
MFLWCCSEFCIITNCLSHRAILFVILNLGSAQNPHVLRVRSGFSALSVFKLPATITPIGIGIKSA